MHRKCKDFSGRNTCQFFITNGACKRPNRFMCHIFKETGKQPIEDDVPEYLGMVLETFPDSKVVEEINPEPRRSEYPPELIPPEEDEDDRWVEIQEKKKNKMEDFFGKI